MIATTMDLRYKTNKIFKALDRNEEVIITYRGKPKATLTPFKAKKKKERSMREHPFFGMRKDDTEPVEEIMKRLRKPRYDPNDF